MASDESEIPNKKQCTEKMEKNPPLTVILTTGDTSFTVSRKLLCKNSMYFDAMLNGNFKEAHSQQIHLHTITADAMECILNFFNFDTVTIPDLNKLKEIFHAANYFGLDAFLKRVEEKLISLIDHDTCFNIFNIYKENNLEQLEPMIKSYILYNFSEIKDNVNELNSVNSLFWYLSHENLNVVDEMEVLNAGCVWLEKHSNRENDILIVLSCLLYKKFNLDSLKTIISNELIANNVTAKSVVEALIFVKENFDMTDIFEARNSKKILNVFTEETYEILKGILSCKEKRTPPIRPSVLMKSNDEVKIMTYDMISKELVTFLDISDRSWWGHNIVSWKGYNVFLLCGKLRKFDVWNYNVLKYNCLTRTWTMMPSTNSIPRRHSTAVVHNDSIYVIGGFGQFRIISKSFQAYNIKTDTWSNLPDFPELTAFIVACFYKDTLYVSGENLYIFQNDNWQILGPGRSRQSAVLFNDNSFYFTEKWMTNVNVISCDILLKNLNNMEHCTVVKKCHHYPAAMCIIRDTVYIFSEGDTVDPLLAIESFNVNDSESTMTNLLWKSVEMSDTSNSYNCFLLADLEIRDNFINEYGKRWLS